MSTKTIKGYKVTDKNMQCRGFQFELNKEYTAKGKIEICENGFHFCPVLKDCFNYYDFKSENRVFEIEANGEVDTREDKICAQKITLSKELSWIEVLELVNTGKGNSGLGNAGNRNAGNDNAGNDNAGNRNAGYANAGNYNAGNDNAGNRNAGYANAGNYNAGNRNAGYANAGNYNAGNRNAGNDNAGNRNAGYANAGNYNAGNRNAGYANAGNDNSGAFCTEGPKYTLFNKPSDWTFEDFTNSRAFSLLHEVNTTQWIPKSSMSTEEKEQHPYCETTDGFVKQIPFKDAFQNSWHNWNEENRKAFTSLPNFNASVFFEITGVQI
jgi:hypothetical protein